MARPRYEGPERILIQFSLRPSIRPGLLALAQRNGFKGISPFMARTLDRLVAYDKQQKKRDEYGGIYLLNRCHTRCPHKQVHSVNTRAYVRTQRYLQGIAEDLGYSHHIGYPGVGTLVTDLADRLVRRDRAFQDGEFMESLANPEPEPTELLQIPISPAFKKYLKIMADQCDETIEEFVPRLINELIDQEIRMDYLDPVDEPT